mgnify:FL=1|jgi:glutaredoxin|tara:strand:+ start:381 stop:620 length:240 start_codon:yes stop_codon:yes gene_type:complete
MTSYLFYLVITKPNCEICDNAKALLERHAVTFTTHNLNHSDWLKTLVGMADLKTVPQVFGYNGEYIGGYEELKKHLGET